VSGVETCPAYELGYCDGYAGVGPRQGCNEEYQEGYADGRADSEPDPEF
jgi:hypothetical protein